MANQKYNVNTSEPLGETLAQLGWDDNVTMTDLTAVCMILLEHVIALQRQVKQLSTTKEEVK